MFKWTVSCKWQFHFLNWFYRKHLLRPSWHKPSKEPLTERKINWLKMWDYLEYQRFQREYKIFSQNFNLISFSFQKYLSLLLNELIFQINFKLLKYVLYDSTFCVIIIKSYEAELIIRMDSKMLAPMQTHIRRRNCYISFV